MIAKQRLLAGVAHARSGRVGARVWWIWALLGVLMAAQAVGLAHRTAHPRSMALVEAAQVVSVPAQAPGLLSGFFGGHVGGDGECRLLDALAHADPVPASAPMLSAPLGASPPPDAVWAGRIEVAAASHYDARAPPLLR